MKRLLLLFLCLPLFLFSQAPLDSLENSLQTTTDDSEKLSLLNKISNMIWRMDPPKAIEYSLEALQLAEAADNLHAETVACRNLASAYGFSGEHKSSLEFGLRALEGSETLRDTTLIRRSLYAIGYTYLALEENEKALRTITRIWHLVKDGNSDKLKANALHHLGLVHNALEDYEKVLEFSQQSLDISEKIGNTPQVTYSLGLLGLANRNLSKPRAALEYFQRSLAISEASNDRLGLIYGYCDIGITYRQLGQLQSSLNYLNKSLVLAQEMHFSDELITIHEELAMTNEALGRYRAALNNFKSFKQYSDSLYSEKNARQISELVAKYEIAQKEREQEITLLRKDNEIQELDLNRQMWLRNFLLAILILTTVIGGMGYKFYQVNKRAVNTQKSKTLQFQAVNEELNREIEEHKQTTEALAREKESLGVTLASIADGVITTDIKGRIVLLNRVAEKLTGWAQEDAIGKHMPDLLTVASTDVEHCFATMMERSIAHDEIVDHQEPCTLISRDGTERIIAASTAPIHNNDNSITGVVLVIRDITEKQMMEDELRRAHKLESIGTLAGGIAHDFNNILTTILANISYVKFTAQIDAEKYNRLVEAEKASFSARELTQKLLTFAKGGMPVKAISSTRDLIQDAVDLCLSGSNVKCETVFPKGLWNVNVDRGQMAQALSHIIMNADQAMPEGGILRIRTENFALPAANDEELSKARFVKISVSDEGIGIQKAHQKKIFDPYFSTKQKGRGLGLTTAYSIINQHNGFINIESEVGVGSTFHVFLPASVEAAEGVAEKPIITKNGVHKNGGKILIMDDDKTIREIVSVMLERLGYQPHAAEDGVAAIVAFEEAQKSGDPFDVVILDLTVPGGMGGQKAMTELMGIDPEVRAIVASGYSNDPVMANYQNYGFRNYIYKPFDMEELIRILRETIGES